MTDEERASMKLAFPSHYFLMVQHPLGSVVIALPKKQDSPDKEAAVSLWHGAIARLS